MPNVEPPKRNAEPTPEAVFAIIQYADEYEGSKGGPMDFWETLDPERRRHCEESASKIIRAWRKRQPRASRL